MKVLKAVALLSAIFLVLPSALSAQSRCRAYADLSERLSTVYGESRISQGLGLDGNVFETWVSEETGSWTILVVAPSGVSCLVAAGEGYSVPEEVEEDKETF